MFFIKFNFSVKFKQNFLLLLVSNEKMFVSNLNKLYEFTRVVSSRPLKNVNFLCNVTVTRTRNACMYLDSRSDLQHPIYCAFAREIRTFQRHLREKMTATNNKITRYTLSALPSVRQGRKPWLDHESKHFSSIKRRLVAILAANDVCAAFLRGRRAQ